MYQPYPGGADPREPAPASAPPSLLRAVKVMYVGVAASLIGIVVDMTTLSSTRAAIIKHSPTLTATQVNNAEHVEIGLFIAGGLIGAALWLWMAQSCRAGKGWARIVSTVFFAIDTVIVLIAVGGGATGGGGLARVYGFVIWAVGLIAIILLWQRASSGYFRSARRY
jgi:hypothetical protein